jgi:hypothetical protein
MLKNGNSLKMKKCVYTCQNVVNLSKKFNVIFLVLNVAIYMYTHTETIFQQPMKTLNSFTPNH